MQNERPVLRLRPGRDASARRRHPWIFSGSVASEPVGARPGDLVRVEAADGAFLAWGFWSPASQIRVRALSFDEADDPAAPGWLAGRIGAAWARRAGWWDRASRNAVRVVHGEGDGLPGLVVDRYASALCVQIHSAGFDRRRSELAAALLDLFPDAALVWERSDGRERAREGLSPRSGRLAERPGADAPDPAAVEIVLDGVRRAVDLAAGQKTGAYLDQTRNHALVGALAEGREVLDAFSFDGGFSLACLRGGASRVAALDASAAALAALRANLSRNGFAPDAVECLRGDAFETLRALHAEGRRFDLVVLDPPKLADAKPKVVKACRAYKDANRLAFSLLRPGGLLATFSCSGAVDPALFRTVVAEAAAEAGRAGRVLGLFSQGPDHPVALACPEGFYLKGLLCSAD